MRFAIRLSTPDDAEAVTALLAASYPPLMAGHYEPDALAALLPAITVANPQLLGSGRYFIAETADGTTVGCGGWSTERPGSGEPTEGLGHVRHFATHPDWIGRGIGRALFERCLAQARAAGVTTFECYANLNAEGFYRALGFVPVRPIEVAVSPERSLPATLMRRSD